jgi:zinc transporter
MLWAFRFHEAKAVPLEEGPLVAPDGGWLWTHFPLSDQRAHLTLNRRDDMPAAVRDLLRGGDGAPRILFEGPWAYGILPDFEMEFDGRITGTGRLHFALDDRHLVTTRHHPLKAADDLYHRLAAGKLLLARPVDGVLVLAGRYCDLSQMHLNDLAERVDDMEDEVFSERQDPEELEIGALRRDLARRHREISALRTACRRAIGETEEIEEEGGEAHPLTAGLPSIEQRGTELDRATLALQDRARLIHEDIDTKITSATNRTLRTLTVLTVVLMPPTLIVGAFGMNLEGIPFAKSSDGFAVVCGLCVVTVAAAFVLLRRLRILK